MKKFFLITTSMLLSLGAIAQRSYNQDPTQYYGFKTLNFILDKEGHTKKVEIEMKDHNRNILCELSADERHKYYLDRSVTGSEQLGGLSLSYATRVEFLEIHGRKPNVAFGQNALAYTLKNHPEHVIANEQTGDVIINFLSLLKDLEKEKLEKNLTNSEDIFFTARSAALSLSDACDRIAGGAAMHILLSETGFLFKEQELVREPGVDGQNRKSENNGVFGQIRTLKGGGEDR